MYPLPVAFAGTSSAGAHPDVAREYTAEPAGGNRAEAVVPETATAAMAGGASPGLPGAGGPVVQGPGAGIPGKSGEERLKEMEAEMAL